MAVSALSPKPRDYDVELISPEFFRDFVSATFDIALVISPDGRIVSILSKDMGQSLGDLSHWENKPINEFLTIESVPKFESAHRRFKSGIRLHKRIELNHLYNSTVDEVGSEFPICYTLHRYCDTDFMLMLGRDLRPIAETQQQLVKAQIALEKNYEEQRKFDTKYRVLLSNSSEAILFVSVHDGRIRDMNEAAAKLLGMEQRKLRNVYFSEAFRNYDSKTLINAMLEASANLEQDFLNLQSQSGKISLKIFPTEFRVADERLIMVRIEPDGDTVRPIHQTSSSILAFFRDSHEAFVCIDTRGFIIDANESFLQLINAVNVSTIKERPLSDFLGRGQIEQKMLIDNARNNKSMRVYPTKLVNDFGSYTAVEITTTPFSYRGDLGIGLIIRDCGQIEGMGEPVNSSELESTHRKLMDLVGSARLKEIVAEATDVVEKMCIETAVNLTRNNRVAAAEMLGLSRQSLYVKLRKYGLLKKNKGL
ncbi:MAG: transcriptional regulator PpsR [Aestuariivita sp.]|nr:transcriptional regulator PpsR [Aestuariivita sp.]